MIYQIGLIGHPLSHSHSPELFTELFREKGIDFLDYQLFPLSKLEKLPELIKSNPQLIGLNVTIPYKVEVMRYLKHIDQQAAEAGAVNTLVIRRKTTDSFELHGFNTDITGVEKSLDALLGDTRPDALILGTGGASKAVQFVLRKKKLRHRVVSRNDGPMAVYRYEDLNRDIIQSYLLIINTTPCGMFPNINSGPPLIYDGIGKEHLLFDLIYNPAETNFLRHGRALGAKTMNGADMLRTQAEHALRLWLEEVSNHRTKK